MGKGSAMKRFLGTVELATRKPGILLYSPFASAHIREGENYFKSKFFEPEGVAAHVRNGTLVAFLTEGAGTYVLRFFEGEPEADEVTEYPFRIALPLEVRDGSVCVRDVDDLSAWEGACPDNHKIAVKDGYYHLLLLSKLPPSGERGDDQEILIYLDRRQELPKTMWTGIPTLEVTGKAVE